MTAGSATAPWSTDSTDTAGARDVTCLVEASVIALTLVLRLTGMARTSPRNGTTSVCATFGGS